MWKWLKRLLVSNRASCDAVGTSINTDWWTGRRSIDARDLFATPEGQRLLNSLRELEAAHRNSRPPA